MMNPTESECIISARICAMTNITDKTNHISIKNFQLFLAQDFFKSNGSKGDSYFYRLLPDEKMAE